MLPRSLFHPSGTALVKTLCEANLCIEDTCAEGMKEKKVELPKKRGFEI